MRLTQNADLSALNAFGVKAAANGLARLEHWYDIESLVETPDWQQPRLVVGEGSNILFRGDFHGLVIHMENRGIQIVEEDDQSVLIRVAAGERWSELVRWCAMRFMWGIENLAHIPGLSGAAPIQNIGAYGCELSKTLESVTAWDCQEHTWTTMSRERCALGYRNSRFRDRDHGRFLITEIALRLARHGLPRIDYPGVCDALNEAHGLNLNPDADNESSQAALRSLTPMDMVDVITRIRRSKLPDPSRLGNAGSFFKNPIVSEAVASALSKDHPQLARYPQDNGTVKLSAAWMIDCCGLKGQRLGDAGLFENHALVLVNHGQATGQELWEFAMDVQAKVHHRFGINLEPEPIIV